MSRPELRLDSGSARTAIPEDTRMSVRANCPYVYALIPSVRLLSAQASAESCMQHEASSTSVRQRSAVLRHRIRVEVITASMKKGEPAMGVAQNFSGITAV